MIAGPSGVGKGTIIHQLIGRDPRLALSISCTTRAPREGEVDGVDYHFTTREGFQRLIDDDALLEWADVFGQRYGTLAAPIEAARDAGGDVVLEIDVQGARSVRDRLGDDATLIFIEPPSTDDLARRLDERGTETADSIADRLATAADEMAAASWFDHRVTNDDLEEAVSQVAAIIGGRRDDSSSQADQEGSP